MHRREDQLRRGGARSSRTMTPSSCSICRRTWGNWSSPPSTRPTGSSFRSMSASGGAGITMFLEWSAHRAAEVIPPELLGVLVTKYEKNTLISRETVASLAQRRSPTVRHGDSQARRDRRDDQSEVGCR